jgi:serine/threonine-protein kinase HipA
MSILTVQIHRKGQWLDAAEIRFSEPAGGHRSPTKLDYIGSYVVEELGNAHIGGAVVSSRCPVDFSTYDSERWPAFLLDLLPGGEGRRRWAERLQIGTGLSAELQLLSHAAANPPGNIRIKEAAESSFRQLDRIPDAEGDLREKSEHPGFEQVEIINRQEHFIEYAYNQGAAVAGASDVQGEAPKFLLVQDQGNRWHAEGALDDKHVAKHWIVKFPRGRHVSDKDVLYNEAPDLELARRCGLKVGEALQREGQALFIPRFDRAVANNTVKRIGMESLYSIAGVSEFGVARSHEFLCEALLKYLADDVKLENITEYIKRDILNVILGNTDNHGRNTAVLRDESGDVTLSPLFDFAPMYLDPEGIARVTRWEATREEAGSPLWPQVCDYFEPWVDTVQLRQSIREFAGKLAELPSFMREEGVSPSIIDRRLKSIENNLLRLREC